MQSSAAIAFMGEEPTPRHGSSPNLKPTLTERFQATIIHIPVKDLARAAQCSPETAKSWKAGKAVPYGHYMFKLGQSYDCVREWIIDESDPNGGIGKTIARLQQQALMGGHEGADARAKLNNIMAAARGA